jgi:cold shock CspA family protein
MAISSNKRELQKKKVEKRQEKQKRKEVRKASGGSGSFEDMIAYVDENGVIVSTPPDPTKRKYEVEDIAISTPKKEDVEETVMEGRVEYFNPDKGYGFIKHNATMYKYFFHISNVPANIKEGNNVTFELERGPKGMNAVKVTIVG